jgi:HD-GYP domain-containing protein (c-di-GMP phosphodiesterase class II)/pSer/pThr/pTyr-binding forkhead associated (FHA) protein
MVKRTIRLRGMNGPMKGQVWEASDLLRVGRLEALEIVLDDSSVSRYHAEVRATENGWRVRDLGSTNGTRLNGVRLGNGQWPLRVRDLLQFGEIAVVVEGMEEEAAEQREDLVPGSEMRVTGTARSTWNEAMEGLAYDSNHCLRAGEQLQALLRAGHHLVHIEKEEELLHSILEDAVAVLDAKRGAIALLEGSEEKLQLRALVSGRNAPRAALGGRGEVGGRFQFSQNLARRCITRGESILCHRAEEDPELALAKSIAEGTMSSVLCVLLRTPRHRLGVLHLDRGPWQKPFTLEDLHLADALAANVSAGIECATLLRKQRDLFLDTVTILAQAIELRDDYTGGHTRRVSTYAVLLAEALEIPPEQLHWIRVGTPLHDIGKIGIDDAVLRKPGRLTDDEFEHMKEHTVKGDEIIQTIPDLQPIRPIVRSHHERYDGGGYPDGLAGDDISPLARVVALADAFDAMTSNRPYRKGLDPLVAFTEIEKMAGRQFDPAFAHAFLEIRPQILAEMDAHRSAAHPDRPTRACAATPAVFPAPGS